MNDYAIHSSYDEIQFFCKNVLHLEIFTVNPRTAEVSTENDVNFDNNSLDFLTHPPFKFSYIGGNLALNHTFTSWENCPEEIGNSLYLNQADLPLIGMPKVNNIFSMTKSNISSLEGIGKCRKLRANNSKLVDFSSLPVGTQIGSIEVGGENLNSLKGITNMGGFWEFCIGSPSRNLSPYEMRYLLLCNFEEFTFCEQETTRLGDLEEILMDGRERGIMPSELIPEKIKQLKEMR